ncbi:MAG: NAD(P)-binding protein [Planctomycetes bacterium]|nr:NAD(P)-binding protein [Planctomycetota bacterium]
MTRRRFLGAGAAVAAGWAGGWGGWGGRWLGAAAPPIAGTIVGASAALGHRLRGGAGAFPPPGETRDVGTVIVGGGIAGLAAGWKLAKCGVRDLELLELEPETGGNARWGEAGATAYPWGAHYVPLPTAHSTAVRELFAELGVIREYREGAPVYDERYLCHAPEARLFQHGRWNSGIFPKSGMTPEEAAEVERFRRATAAWRAWRDARGRPAFALPMEYGSDDAEVTALDRISIGDWLERAGYRSARLRWYVEYCCRDDYGCTLDTTSAWAALHYFCGRGLEDPEVLTWPEGNGWLARRMAARLAGRITTGAVVFRVAPTEAGGGATVDYLDARRGATVRLRARHVIYALPRFTARHVVAGGAADDSGIGDFTYAPWAVANLHVDRAPAGAAWDNVIHGSDSLGYIVATHQALTAAPGPSVLTWYRPFTGADPAAERRGMLERRWEDWRDAALGDLRRPHRDIDARVRRLDVMLWGHAMIRPVPGFVWGAARRAAAATACGEEAGASAGGGGCGPILFAHSDLSGLSLFEEAQYRGVRAAEAVLRRDGVPFVSSLAPRG